MIDFYPGLKFRVTNPISHKTDDYTVISNNGNVVVVMCHSNGRTLTAPITSLTRVIEEYGFIRLNSFKLKNIYIDTKSGPVLIK